MRKYYPSVKLIEEKCIGCTDCIKRCPTEAIRVRNGKAHIINEKCIDCGLCIKVCRNNAKKATTDSLEQILNSKFKYKVVMPAPTFYSQFKNTSINTILTALKHIGFDEVFEVAKGADIVTKKSVELINNRSFNKPIISSACPAIVRLIQIRFPSLINNILPILSPMEATARLGKQYLIKKGIQEKDIGMFFITPCAAKVTNVRNPQIVKKSYVDGVVSIKELYMKLIPVIKKLKEQDIETLRSSSLKGINWANNGGEAKALGIENVIAVDGIENVIDILESVESGKLQDVDFIEGLACTSGCLGGPLTVENSFVAKNRMSKIINTNINDQKIRKLNFNEDKLTLQWENNLNPQSIIKLDEDINRALTKMEKIQLIYNSLPQIDCGSCGAPTCRALAEDIVLGKANIEDCIFMLRQKVREMAQEMVNLSKKLPPAIAPNDKDDIDKEIG